MLVTERWPDGKIVEYIIPDSPPPPQCVLPEAALDLVKNLMADMVAATAILQLVADDVIARFSIRT